MSCMRQLHQNIGIRLRFGSHQFTTTDCHKEFRTSERWHCPESETNFPFYHISYTLLMICNSGVCSKQIAVLGELPHTSTAHTHSLPLASTCRFHRFLEVPPRDTRVVRSHHALSNSKKRTRTPGTRSLKHIRSTGRTPN